MNTSIQKLPEQTFILQKVEPHLQAIVKFFDNPTVMQVSESELKSAIDIAITKILMDTGRQMPDEDIKYMVNELAFSFVTKYRSVRIPEIAVAFKRGVRKEYGDYFGINAAELERFIRCYVEDINRQNAMKSYLKAIEAAAEKPAPTEAEQQQLIRENIINAFEVYKEKSWYNDIANGVFNMLYNYELLEFSEEDIKSFYETARKRLLSHYNSDIGLHFFSRHKTKAQIKRLQKISLKDMINDKEIVSEANRVALNHFFANLVKAGTDIKDVLEFI